MSDGPSVAGPRQEPVGDDVGGGSEQLARLRAPRELLERFQGRLVDLGIPLEWPEHIRSYQR